MVESNYIIQQCLQCNDAYEAWGPLDYLSQDVTAFGFCSKTCVFSYCKRTGTDYSDIRYKNIKYLKQVGNHHVADWLACGGLERLVE